MPNYLRGTYKVQNPGKYVGKKLPIYRSSWELSVCRMCDEHSSILEWSSESIKIPYRNPLTGKYTVYVPDFVVLLEDENQKLKLEVWEIKPRKQSFVAEAKSTRDKAALVVNAAKWQQAIIWADRHGATFRVINENDIFRNV